MPRQKNIAANDLSVLLFNAFIAKWNQRISFDKRTNISFSFRTIENNIPTAYYTHHILDIHCVQLEIGSVWNRSKKNKTSSNVGQCSLTIDVYFNSSLEGRNFSTDAFQKKIMQLLQSTFIVQMHLLGIFYRNYPTHNFKYMLFFQ